jgi:hypothetical protein
LDPGKLHDHPALVVAEVRARVTDRWAHEDWYHRKHGRCSLCCGPEREALYVVRALYRTELGTKHAAKAALAAEVVDGVAERLLAEAPPQLGLVDPAADRRAAERQVHLCYDCTGVGEALGELLTAALEQRACEVQPVLSTSGERLHREAGRLHAAKTWLIARQAMLVETGRVQAANRPEIATLLHELQVFERKVTAAGHATYNAPEGEHDDVLCALSLACLLDPIQQGAVWRGPDLWD